MTCSSCGATNPAGAAWCSLCHQSLDAVPTPAVPGRAVPAPAGPPAPFVYSRWRKTATTFGPVGRVTWTVAVALVMAVTVLSGDLLAIGPICFIAAPLVLRSVWGRGRLV